MKQRYYYLICPCKKESILEKERKPMEVFFLVSKQSYFQNKTTNYLPYCFQKNMKRRL